MIITKSRTEPITLETLDAFLANFATGIITLDELWEAIEDAGDIAYFKNKLLNPMDFSDIDFPDAIENHMSGVDAGHGI